MFRYLSIKGIILYAFSIIMFSIASPVCAAGFHGGGGFNGSGEHFESHSDFNAQRAINYNTAVRMQANREAYAYDSMIPMGYEPVFESNDDDDSNDGGDDNSSVYEDNDE